MKLLIALAAGYVIGAKTGGKELDDLGRSIKALCDTEEFADVVTAARIHVGSTLREVAAILDGEHPMPEIGGDLVARVRQLVDHG
jgi:hypothetical protein